MLPGAENLTYHFNKRWAGVCVESDNDEEVEKVLMSGACEDYIRLSVTQVLGWHKQQKKR
jgi:hypothetical protein